MKKIYAYDLNMPSALTFFYKKAKEKGIPIIHVENPSEIEPDAEIVIMNPLCSIFNKHWEGIRDYIIRKNIATRVFVNAPSLTRREVAELVGNVQGLTLTTSEDWRRGSLTDNLVTLLNELEEQSK